MEKVLDTEIVCIIQESIKLPNHLISTCNSYQVHPHTHMHKLALEGNFDVCGETGWAMLLLLLLLKHTFVPLQRLVTSDLSPVRASLDDAKIRNPWSFAQPIEMPVGIINAAIVENSVGTKMKTWLMVRCYCIKSTFRAGHHVLKREILWDVFNVGILMYILETLPMYLFHSIKLGRTDCKFSGKHVGSLHWCLV